MKNLLCYLGFHSWGAWRRPRKPKVSPMEYVKVDVSYTPVKIQTQHRYCRRCRKQQTRSVPLVFTVPKQVDTVYVKAIGGGGGGGSGKSPPT